MVDLETTGLDPTDNAVIQIAAVQFDFAAGTIGKVFDQCLELPPNRYWDEGTRTWWGDQKAGILSSIQERAAPPNFVIGNFVEWCREIAPTGGLRFWSKPLSFDFPFLSSYFRQYGYANPFFFRDAVDMQSFIRGMRRAPGAPAFDKEVLFEGSAHNALDDTFHQIRVAITARDTFQ